MKKLLLVLIFLGAIGSNATTADNEKDTYLPGQMIIQLKTAGQGQAPRAVSSLEGDFSATGLKMSKVLSARLGIYLFSFDPARAISDQALLDEVRQHGHVLEAQFNHYVELRETEPDDPNFPDQWPLKNTGQLLGVIDADIDATDAWDIATGGVTPLGDTIIIAIIDDGFDLGHDDIAYWVNRHEIPGNGIDDDSNGYVDDYRGWNAYSSTGTITSKDHGTHVTGIAGALGNNGIGVSGVNWDARILPVMGSTIIESVVVEAYGYVYAQRAMYNETNGALGAFIVVTNCSFGVNYGQPEDYPIWGAMYDSLGQLGVLNAGATANMNINVDEEGDIPTAFDSDYLITVTNTTMQDEKYLIAGWGPVSIDLGAPGKNVYSTRQGNTYGYKTGTSMSAPHVAGTVALMLAAAEPDFVDSYHMHPSDIAMLLKHYILQGVDEVPGLVDSTVSGGRLNVFNSINLMLTHALESDADPLQVTTYKDSTEDLSFTLRNTADLDLAYEAAVEPNEDWITIEPLSGMIPAGDSVELTAHFDATGLEQGVYDGLLEAVNIRGDKVYIHIRMEVFDPEAIAEESPDRINLKLFPNPGSSSTRLQYQLHSKRNLVIDLLDLEGRKVAELLNGAKDHGLHEMEIDVSGLPAGVYYIRVRASQEIAIAKLLVYR